MKKLILIAALATSAYPIFGQKGVVKVQENTNIGSGVFYYLPNTELVIDVIIEKTEYIPGELNAFAELYLGETPASKAQTSYQIADIKIKTRTKADADELYFAGVAGAPFNLVLNPDQTIKSINIEPKDLQTTNAATHNKDKQNNTGNQYRFIKTSEKLDTIYTRQIIDSVLIEKRTIQKVYKKTSKEETAKAAAQKLAEIQNFKYSLLSYNEDDTYSAETIKLKLAELNKLEEAYLEQFNGKKTITKTTEQFTFLPQSNGVFKLFLFDELKGITNNISNADEIKIQIKTETPIKTVDKNTTGFVYKQAANATVSILSDEQVITEVQLPILQLGQIKRLPADDLSKIKIEFDSQNGSIKQFGIIGK